MPTVTLFIPGRPVPKQSFRMSSRGAWQPSRVVKYGRRVRWLADDAVRRSRWLVPDESQPLRVSIFLGYARPKSAKKSLQKAVTLRCKVPDIDNAVKSILDGCAPLWNDDRQVAELSVRKLTVPRGEEGVTITVETIDDGRSHQIITEYLQRRSETSWSG